MKRKVKSGLEEISGVRTMPRVKWLGEAEEGEGTQNQEAGVVGWVIGVLGAPRVMEGLEWGRGLSLNSPGES